MVELAITLRDLGVQSIPVNFLNPIDGTPLAGRRDLNPRYCLKVLAMFRLVNPDREIRIAGGRELHLGSMQALGLYAANSIFVGDYLTTKGQPPEADYPDDPRPGLRDRAQSGSQSHSLDGMPGSRRGSSPSRMCQHASAAPAASSTPPICAAYPQLLTGNFSEIG